MSVTFFGVIRIVAKRRIAIFGLYFKVLKKGCAEKVFHWRKNEVSTKDFFSKYKYLMENFTFCAVFTTTCRINIVSVSLHFFTSYKCLKGIWFFEFYVVSYLFIAVVQDIKNISVLPVDQRDHWFPFPRHRN